MTSTETCAARAADPWTSLSAARAAAQCASEHRAKILETIKLADRPVGGTEIAMLCGLTQVQVCRRLPELLREQRIRIAPGIGETASGRHERLWEAAW